MKQQVSNQVSIHTEFDGLFAIRDDRNGNLVIMTEEELQHLLDIAQDLLDDYDLARQLKSDDSFGGDGE